MDVPLFPDTPAPPVAPAAPLTIPICDIVEDDKVNTVPADPPVPDEAPPPGAAFPLARIRSVIKVEPGVELTYESEPAEPAAVESPDGAPAPP